MLFLRCVRMCVRVLLGKLQVVMLVCLFDDLAMLEHVDLRRRNTAAVDLFDSKGCADVEREHSLFENRSGNAGVEQGSQKHIAGRTGKAFKIGKTHEAPFSAS